MRRRPGRGNLPAPHKTPSWVEMMDDQVDRPTPRHVIESLDASVRDIGAGRVHDAHAAQAEARRLLAEHETAASSGRGPHRVTNRRRTRSMS
jgi:hypothetical protein